MPPKLRLPLLHALFFLSGFSALAVELVYVKYLGYVFGTTAYAVSTVLASFMGGLALGNLWGGKLSRSIARPVRWYGCLEFGVGLYGLLSPLLFRGLAELVGSVGRPLTEGSTSLFALTILRFLLAALVVLPPTVAMGLSFPLLTGWLRTRPDLGSNIARLYTVNTLGAATGTLVCTYVFLGALGLSGTLALVATINACVLGGCLAFPKAEPASPETAPSPADADVAPAPVLESSGWLNQTNVYVLAAFSGFITLAFEVVWSHLLATLIGTSTYAFGLVLAIFLFALALGGTIVTLYVADLGARRVAAFLAVALLACGLSIALTLSFWDKAATVFELVGYFKPGFGARELTRAVVVGALIFLPVLLMGLLFPAALAMQRAAGADVGRRVGIAYALNTAGTIVGSTLTGFGLIEWLGSQATIRLLGALTLLLALPALWVIERRRWRFGLAATGVLSLASLAWADPWDIARMTNGTNIYFVAGFDLAQHKLVDFREDVHGGMTTVVSDGTVRTMMTNGKFEGNNGRERIDQILVAVIPNLYVRGRERAVNIGIGTGQTLAVLQAFGYRDLDAVDISPNIVGAATRMFGDVNLDVFREPNVHVHLRDGRNHLLLSESTYDLISVELSSIWFASAGNLYSREFYQLCRRRLREHGVLQQWMQLHHIELENIATIIRTLKTVFPAVELWIGGHQGILVAADHLEEPVTAGLGSVSPKLSRLLEAAEIDDPREILKHRLVRADQMDGVLAAISHEPRRLSTDDNVILEYSTPQGNTLDGAEIANLKAIRQAVAARPERK
jgi:spermidine synthase